MCFSRLGSRLCQGHGSRWRGALPSFFLFLLPVVPVEVSCKLRSNEGGDEEALVWARKQGASTRDRCLPQGQCPLPEALMSSGETSMESAEPQDDVL